MFSLYLRRSPALAGVLFAVFALIGALFLVPKVMHLAQVTRELYPGEGTVLAVRPPARKRSPKLDVRYSDRDGIERVSTLSVSRSRWTQYRRGGQVGLFISGVDPNEAWARDEGIPSPWDLAMPAGIVAAMFLIGALTTASGFRKAGLRARAIETGIPLPGRVVSVVEGTGKARGHWTLAYSWRVNGREYLSKSPRLQTSEAQRYHPGDEVPVFVDPRDEANGEVDVFGFRAGAEQLRAG